MSEISRRRVIVSGTVASFAFAAPALAQAGPIDEQGFVRVGGIDQWIAIQGRDRGNPALLYLHGGPAEAQSPFLEEFAPWQRDFTVVNWDQRGSGKTFGRNGASTPDMTLERMADDVLEIAVHVRRRLGKRKLILVGQSWGAKLGMTAVLRRPELFCAFVGTGQPVNWTLSLLDLERFARAEAEAAGDAAALAALDQAAKLPVDDLKRLSATNRWRMSPSDLDYLKRVQGGFLGQPPYPTTGEVGDWIAGGQFSIPKLLPTITRFDARKLGAMPVPVFVIQGRDDHVASFAVARTYVAALQAPAKAFVAIDGGHFACFTNTNAFLDAMRTYARPLG